ncbi:arginine/serine-rich protein PNISR-like isoform X2 [Pseudomyrmex gracilis]|uniref:arginine/serine-rich protein PNISR-like isoform X2 n=1 Tax=Pseudomyrmex gracilis TaxID=219809 RepID=UPI00099592FD|nr:arginine/serine-rich protein PNISR-like isoform X2 [Pseudomyrmex gracilis]
MLKQCHDPKCIASEKKLTTHEKKSHEESNKKSKNPRSFLTSNRNSLRNFAESLNKLRHKRVELNSRNAQNSRIANKSRNCRNKKCQGTQSTSKSSTKNLHATQSARANKFGQVSDRSQNLTGQICTCRKGNSHERSRSRSVSEERSERQRKRSRSRRKKTSNRESNRPMRDCFRTTLCICVRGRSLDEPRNCKCTLSQDIPSPSHRECCCIKGEQKGNTSTNISKNDSQVDKHIADPSTSKKKLKHPHESSLIKPNKERGVIIRGLNTVHREIDRLGKSIIRRFTSQRI